MPRSHAETTDGSSRAARKIHPKLLPLERVITSNKAFKNLIDNFDAFDNDDYQHSPYVTSAIDPAFHDLVQLLQSREHGTRYSLYDVLENAGDTLVTAIESGLPTARKGTVLLEALRPYLLLDRWLTAFRTDECKMKGRPSMPLDDLKMVDDNAKVRKALHRSYVTTMRNLTPASTYAHVVFTSNTCIASLDKNLSELINRGIGARRQSKISIAEYRFTSIAIVTSLFTQKALSNEEIYAEASKLLDHVSEKEWRAVLRDGISWLGMALLTTLKDALVYPPHEPPSARLLFVIGNRYRQQNPVTEFIKLETRLWRHLFETSLNITTMSLESLLAGMGPLAMAERPDTVTLTMVPLVKEDPQGSVNEKRKFIALDAEEGGRMQKRLREYDEEEDILEDDRMDDDDYDCHQSNVRQSAIPDKNCAQTQFPPAKESSIVSGAHTGAIVEDQGALSGTSDDSPVERGTPFGLHTVQPALPNHPPTTDKPSSLPCERGESAMQFGGPSVDANDTVHPSAENPVSGSSVNVKSVEESHGGSVGSSPVTASEAILEVSTSMSKKTSTTAPYPNTHNTRGSKERSGTTPLDGELKGKNVGGHNLRANAAKNPKVELALNQLEGRKSSTKRNAPRRHIAKVKVELPDILQIFENVDYEELDATVLVGIIKVEDEDDASYYPLIEDKISEGQDRDSFTPDATKDKVKEAGGEKNATPQSLEASGVIEDEKDNKRWKLRVDATAPSDAQVSRITVNGAVHEIHTWYEGDFKQYAKFNEIFAQKSQSTDMIRRIEYADFKACDTGKLRDIMKTMHVLVTNNPPLISVTDMERRLGMKRKVEIQDQWYRRKNRIPCHCLGTLAQMKSIIDADKLHNRPLNALDLPCGHVRIDIPRLLDVSFRDTVWSSLRHVDRPTYEETMPMDEFRWALYSSRNAYSTPHIDSNGLWTVIAPIDCTKLWMVARPKKEALLDTRAFSSFEMYDLAMDDYEWEPLVLKAGDLFYMRPGTIHAVITLEPGFTIGEHFFTTASLTDSLASIFHLSAKESFLTNASHNIAVAKTLIRLIHCWRLRLDDEVDEDLPEMVLDNADDLKALVMLGTYIHLVVYIEDKVLTPADAEQLITANEDYKILYNYFKQNFLVQHLRYKKYIFPVNDSAPVELLDGQSAEDHGEDMILDMIFRNGWIWITGNICVFFDREDQTKEVIASKIRIDTIVDYLAKLYKVERSRFDRVKQWLNDNFETACLDDWIDWKSLKILRKPTKGPLRPDDPQSPGHSSDDERSSISSALSPPPDSP